MQMWAKYAHACILYVQRLIPTGMMDVRDLQGGRTRLFLCVMKTTKKMHSALVIILPVLSRRDLCYASEIAGFRFYIVFGSGTARGNQCWRVPWATGPGNLRRKVNWGILLYIYIYI